MTSPPLDCTHDRMMSGVTCHHRLWAAPSVERRLLWHVIIAVGQHTRLNDIVRGITSLPLDSTLGRQRRAWHDNTALGQHTQSNDVGRGIKSPPSDSTHSRTTSGMAFHHRLWAAHTVKRRWAWHDITAFGKHSRSKEVRNDIPSPPLHCTHDRMTSCVACHHRPWTVHMVGNVGRGMTSPLLDNTHSRTTSGMA